MTKNDRERTDFLVNRGDWHQCRTAKAPVAELKTNEVSFRIDRFAFTANNVTYAVVGDMLGYWNFFPTGEEGWGKLPVWGFADVEGSGHSGVKEGDRYFGCWPSSTHLTVLADRIDETGLIDASPHRREYAAVYSQYARVAADPHYDPAHEARHALFRPLFMTAFLIDDLIADNDFFGARTVALASASSKTAIALAFLLSGRKACKVVGLTSKRNRDFVESVGCYDTVVPYGEIGSLPKEPAVLVDMAGDAEVLAAFHRHVGDGVKYSCLVGATHWDRGAIAEGPPAGLPGAQPQFFFAPTQAEQRIEDWGLEGLRDRMGRAWTAFRDSTQKWLEVEEENGPAALERVYLETLDGKVEPSVGHVLSLHTG